MATCSLLRRIQLVVSDEILALSLNFLEFDFIIEPEDWTTSELKRWLQAVSDFIARLFGLG